MRITAPCGHKVNLLGRLAALDLGRKKGGLLQWSGTCATCKVIYRFTVEGILAVIKVK